MKKRLVSLLLLAVFLTTAPMALADHCRKCKPLTNTCTIAVTGGYPFCDDTLGGCVTSGTWCTGPHPFTEGDSLQADFVVASVERLDEAPQPAQPQQTQVASVEVAAPATR